MKPLLPVLVLAVLCGFLWPTVQGAEDNKLPAAALTILTKAEQVEMLSLDPAVRVEGATGYHGYKVLGKTAIKDAAVRKNLVESFIKSMAGKIDPARCFEPRHGIRAVHAGKTVELVICFQCSQFHLYDASGNKAPTLLVSKAAEPAFDKILKDAGIPKAK